MTDEVVPVEPIRFGLLLENDRSAAPMYLVGYIGDEPVCRTTTTLAAGKRTSVVFEMVVVKSSFYLDHPKHGPLLYPMQWPAFMPGMLIGMPVGMPPEQLFCT
jgi:hypothetical protein